MRHALSLFLILFGLWLIMSGHYLGWLVALGAASAALTVWIARRLEAIDHEGHPLHLAWRGMPYWGWLLVEIVKSNIDVARAILSSPAAIDPSVFKIKAGQRDELGWAVHANSITLTPGTVTMAIDADGTFTVHALTRASRQGVESGEMDRRVSRLMGEA
ncbi:Na+/H+ antiporter subunit E [Magnetospirillum sp. SS-4]|uniref:Na+/H+ antiporter subunit E n=1 Tax=Magnetospirillum sp. SS-4 TaxID=2681465 RepID=UPI00137D3C1B|nr:Na+/H+ antiporter subunit E [Magnetospirillum sp. SS-4]CAA7620742.1 Cation antiporter [Magnetospirillum sp. SS-4]